MHLNAHCLSTLMNIVHARYLVKLYFQCCLDLISFTIIGVLPKYFSSEWSVAQFRLVEGSPYIVAFGHQKNTVVILGMDGR